ncbi:MAG: hypothetical protein ACRDQ2_03425 [Gaiellales bacterium]
MRTFASICLDLWLLSQQPAGEPVPSGHAYQRSVATALARDGLRCIQQAGLHTLWAVRAASGVSHELDAATRGRGSAFLVEAKTGEVAKGDLASFEQKVTDFYFARWRAVAAHAWSPIVATVVPAGEPARRLAFHRAITLCDPVRLPLPVLYHHATHPCSVPRLPSVLCRELARLAPRALQTLQQRYVPEPERGCLRLEPCPYTCTEIDDLLYLQDELSYEVIDRYDRLRPGQLDQRAAWLRRHLPTGRISQHVFDGHR